MLSLPIVYVPGFAGEGFGGGYYTDDLFYGFNVGSKYVRIASDGEQVFRRFEGPLLRLMSDHDYRLFVRGDQQAWLIAQADNTVASKSIWFHQYDISASQWATKPDAFMIEGAAENLLALIELIKAKTGAPRVHLVAHSIGGLVCRSLIQKIIPELYGGGAAAANFIERLFTYATPHGGIEQPNWTEPHDGTPTLLSEVRPDRMYQYLSPGSRDPMPEFWDPQLIPEEIFPASRIFSLIGTMADDLGLGRSSASETDYIRSDGRVPFERAYVRGSYQAFVHRSHGGRYGIVNSEEGYEYMRRFLLGDFEVQAQLISQHLPEGDGLSWQAEVEVALRGVPVILEQRTVSHACPILLAPPMESDAPVSAVPLVSMFYLMEDLINPKHLRWTLRLRVISLRERLGSEVYWDNIVGVAEFEDLIIIDIGQDEHGVRTWVAWNSQVPSFLRDRDPITSWFAMSSDSSVTVPLPSAGMNLLGADAAIRLTTKAR